MFCDHAGLKVQLAIGNSTMGCDYAIAYGGLVRKLRGMLVFSVSFVLNQLVLDTAAFG
jgi:hypothetical protein